MANGESLRVNDRTAGNVAQPSRLEAVSLIDQGIGDSQSVPLRRSGFRRDARATLPDLTLTIGATERRS